MFRITSRTLFQYVNSIKGRSSLILESNERTFICLPKHFMSAPFSTETKQTGGIKSPLASLINNDAATITPEPAKESSEEDDKKSREQSWKKMKLTLSIFGASFTCLGLYLIIELGRPRTDEHGAVVTDRFSKMPLIKQYVYRTVNELNYYGQLLKEPSREKLLPDPVTAPYYQPKYTVVLEFTDVLVHPEWKYQTGWRFKKRPGLDHFLEAVAGTFEIVVYTAEQGMTVFPIIDALDPKGHINYKLVRDATLFIDGQHVKDIDKLNRDLTKVILVDWNRESTKYHPENVLQIPRWHGEDDDMMFMHLASFLITIAQSDIEDVRGVVTYYNQFPNPLLTFREKQLQLMEKTSEVPVEETTKSQITKKQKWTPSFLKKATV